MSRPIAAALVLAFVSGAAPAAASAWARVLEGPLFDFLVDAEPLADGGVLASGTTWSWSSGSRDRWLVRLDRDGDVLWQVAAGTPADEPPGPIGHEPASGATCLAIGDAVVARIDGNGTPSWALRLDAPIRALDATPDGACIVAGDDWIARLVSPGAVDWARAIPAPSACAPVASLRRSGLGVLGDGRIVAGTLATDDDGCGSLVADVVAPDGLSAERFTVGQGEGVWGDVRVDSGVTVVTSVIVIDATGTGRLTTHAASLTDGWGLRFEATAGSMEPFVGVVGVTAWGRQVASRAQHADGTLATQRHADSGPVLGAREAHPGVMAGDDSFVAVPRGAPEGRIEKRNGFGELVLGCTVAPSPRPVGLAWAGVPASWPASGTPWTPLAVARAASPATVLVRPADATLAPACGSCASGDVTDADADGVSDDCDDCPGLFNPGQGDLDGDGTGYSCDACTDVDGDGLGEPGFPGACAEDLCPSVADPTNADLDGDGLGDACQPPLEPSALDLRPGAEPLRIRRAGPIEIDVTWEDVGAGEYVLWRGDLAVLRAGLVAHGAIRCALPAPSARAFLESGNLYYLVSARTPGGESSLGRDSAGVERPIPSECR